MNTFARVAIISSATTTAARLARKMHENDERRQDNEVLQKESSDVNNMEEISKQESSDVNNMNDDNAEKKVDVVFTVIIIMLTILTIGLLIYLGILLFEQISNAQEELNYWDEWIGWTPILIKGD